MTPSQELAFQLYALKIPFEQEFVFHPQRKWRLDFAIPVNKIGIEVHGGIYRVSKRNPERGRHTRGKGFTEDREKMNEAAILGWRVIEVTPEHIRNGKAIGWIERVLGR